MNNLNLFIYNTCFLYQFPNTMSIQRSVTSEVTMLEVLPGDEEPISSPTKFLSEIDENDIGTFNTDIPREEFAVLENGKASIEVQGELVACLMTKQYDKAKNICELILRVEPDHKVCKEMYGVIMERIEQLEEQKRNPPNKWDSDDSDDSSDDESAKESDNESDTSSDEDASDKVITHRVGNLTLSYQT